MADLRASATMVMRKEERKGEGEQVFGLWSKKKKERASLSSPSFSFLFCIFFLVSFLSSPVVSFSLLRMREIVKLGSRIGG